MPILRETVEWKRPAPERPRYQPELTDDERANLRAAIRFLRIRHGGSEALAKLLGVKFARVKHASAKSRSIGAAPAIRVARAASVSVDDVLLGRFPAKGACPRCGHVTKGGSP